MKCAEVSANLAAFALSGLEPEEEAKIRRHLASCPGCRGELEYLERVRRALRAAPPLADPPGHLKDRVLSRVHAEAPVPPARGGAGGTSPAEEFPSGGSPIGRLLRPHFVLPAAAAVVAAAVALAVALALALGLLREDASVVSIQLVPTPGEATQLQGYWGVAELHDQSAGNLRVDLRLNNFDEPETESYYEVWLVSGRERVSAGTFTSEGEGETRVRLNVASRGQEYEALIITEESANDRPAPSGEVALEGELR